MTSSICSNASIGTTGRLVDIRDNKTYWVTKLPDSSCWMTQNLDLDLNTGKPLTNIDSDVTEDWVPTNDTLTGVRPSFVSATNEVQSWDPAMGGTPTYCNDGGVAGVCKQSGNSTFSVNNGHDAQGNYYSWGAATAGQAASLTSNTAGEESTQSICPRGWRLPTGGYSNNTDTDLYKAFNELTVEQITASPYYYVYSGTTITGSLTQAGSSGNYWSATASNGSGACYLNLGNAVKPSACGAARYQGFSVRCVAK